MCIEKSPDPPSGIWQWAGSSTAQFLDSVQDYKLCQLPLPNYAETDEATPVESVTTLYMKQ